MTASGSTPASPPPRHPAPVRVHRVRRGRVAAAFEPPPAAAGALRRDLERAVAGEVRFDDGSRALYATDASNYRQVPIGVVVPATVEDAATAIAVAARHDVPVLPRGGGTSLAGQACNVALVIDFSKYCNRILSIDPERRLAVVEPGCVLDDLRDAAEVHHLTFGPDPATHMHNSLGGMIGNNSGGVHSVMAGLTVDNVERLDIVTYDGLRMDAGPADEAGIAQVLAAGGPRAELYRTLLAFRDRHADRLRHGPPTLPRRVSGYACLDWLLPEHGFHLARALVGTEATLVTVLGATLRLVPSPPARATVVLGFPDVFAAADCVPAVLEHRPVALEGLESKLIENMRAKSLHVDKLGALPDGEGWLVVEFGGDTTDEAAAKAGDLAAAFAGTGATSRILTGDAERTEIRVVRESGLGATAWVPGERDTWEGWEDAAVPRERLGAYLRDFRALLDRHGYDAAMYGHFGDGLVHCRINFDLSSEAGLKQWMAFLREAAVLVTSHGGSLSGEHGDGQARGELLTIMYGPELVAAFAEFKRIWDPRGRMNPGKVVEPFPVTANLRVGPDYAPPRPDTHFAYPDDDGSFGRATLRCVGFGKCRRTRIEDGGVMCPSYIATRDEMHSTRGRARLLFEMLRDGPIEAGWRSDAVEEALDLCLACKGCRNDCPVNVDMATYKAEFRARHYAGRLRPRAAYSVGMIHMWSRLGSAVPGLANVMTQTPGLAPLVKWAAGLATTRALPRFARPSFTRRFARRKARETPRGEPVILWPDTFNNHYAPHVLEAAADVLEAMGFTVLLPPRPLCCGRPLYDWGMLDRAKRLLRGILDAIGPDLEAGTPVVGLEPACVSTFRTELPELFPHDPRARRLKEQGFIFSEFVEAHADRARLRRLDRDALMQLHCHHHAVIGAKSQEALLDRLGIAVVARPAGCCGMAGGFGFEAKKQDVSLAVAAHALLPALRDAAPDTLVLADGFSCREQIRQAGGREARHIAELAADALRPAP